MDRFDRQPDRRPDPYEFVPPALSSLLTAAIALFMMVALRRFLAVAPRLGVSGDTRNFFIVAVVIIELVLVWQVWRQGRKAIGLWRSARR